MRSESLSVREVLVRLFLKRQDPISSSFVSNHLTNLRSYLFVSLLLSPQSVLFPRDTPEGQGSPSSLSPTKDEKNTKESEPLVLLKSRDILSFFGLVPNQFCFVFYSLLVEVCNLHVKILEYKT